MHDVINGRPPNTVSICCTKFFETTIFAKTSYFFSQEFFSRAQLIFCEYTDCTVPKCRNIFKRNLKSKNDHRILRIPYQTLMQNIQKNNKKLQRIQNVDLIEYY